MLGMPSGNMLANIPNMLSDRRGDEDARDVDGCLRDCSCSIDSSYVTDLLDRTYCLHWWEVRLMEALLPAKLAESSHEIESVYSWTRNEWLLERFVVEFCRSRKIGSLLVCRYGLAVLSCERTEAEWHGYCPCWKLLPWKVAALMSLANPSVKA